MRNLAAAHDVEPSQSRKDIQRDVSAIYDAFLEERPVTSRAVKDLEAEHL